jgi:hypothetical protein
MKSFGELFILWTKVDFEFISVASVGVLNQYANGLVIFLKHSFEPVFLSAAQHVKK